MFSSIFGNKAELPNPISLKSSDAELQERVDSLSDDESQVYKWLRLYYSERWIAETLFISKTQLRELTRSLCRKLGVSGVRPMLRIYNRLRLASPQEPVNTEAIDSYVEVRTEMEIARRLKKDAI